MIHKYEAGSLPTKPANRLETDTFYRIVSSLNSLLLAQDDLKARAHLIPGGWRDLRACLSLMEKLVHNLLMTFDEKKRGQIARQMKHMRVRVVFGPEASHEPETVMACVASSLPGSSPRLSEYCSAGVSQLPASQFSYSPSALRS